MNQEPVGFWYDLINVVEVQPQKEDSSCGLKSLKNFKTLVLFLWSI